MNNQSSCDLCNHVWIAPNGKYKCSMTKGDILYEFEKENNCPEFEPICDTIVKGVKK